MNRLIIIAKTQTGKEALQKHIKASLKPNFKKRAMMQGLGITQNVSSDDPLTFNINFNKKEISDLLKPEQFTKELEGYMSKENAELNKDYRMDVE